MGFSTPAKVGILTLVALLALGSVVIWKTEIFMVRKGYPLIADFSNIEGLTLGSEVRFRGFKVGKVMRIDPGPYEIKVYSVIDKDIQVPADSYLRVAYDGIVGQKYLEIRPGTSETLYKPPASLKGTKTSAIVDFIDIGAQNLQESKKILEGIRTIVENKKLQDALFKTVYTAEKIASDIEMLTQELRKTNAGIQAIVGDPKFQANVKGTIQETKKTLSSANKFFDTVGSIDLRASGGVDIGSTANAVISNVDIVRRGNNYFRFGMGEGPTRQLGLLDVLFNAQVSKNVSYRIGVINNQLGGGIAYRPSMKTVLRGDIYDINNPRPNWPKIRLGYGYEVRDYMDLVLQGDDLLNDGDRNISIGIRVKPASEQVY
ncbi:MAG: MlaD family protein [Candidatus Margulisiibacteriota bacterium]|nr:MlaD family protein [Candidatus Margulisiibacteriota bacterium]